MFKAEDASAYPNEFISIHLTADRVMSFLHCAQRSPVMYSHMYWAISYVRCTSTQDNAVAYLISGVRLVTTLWDTLW